MPGYVNIGGILVPESSRPSERFYCRICGTRVGTPQLLERHVRACVAQNEAEVHTSSVKHRLPELFQHDREREAWLRTPAGRAWFEKQTGERM